MMPGENYAFCLISITLMVTHFVCHILGHLPDDRLTMSPIGPSLSAQIPLEGGRVGSSTARAGWQAPVRPGALPAFV